MHHYWCHGNKCTLCSMWLKSGPQWSCSYTVNGNHCCDILPQASVYFRVLADLWKTPHWTRIVIWYGARMYRLWEAEYNSGRFYQWWTCMLMGVSRWCGRSHTAFLGVPHLPMPPVGTGLYCIVETRGPPLGSVPQSNYCVSFSAELCACNAPLACCPVFCNGTYHQSLTRWFDCCIKVNQEPDSDVLPQTNWPWGKVEHRPCLVACTRRDMEDIGKKQIV